MGKRTRSILLGALVLSMPATDVFMPTTWTPLSLLMGLCLVGICIRKKTFWELTGTDLLLLGTLLSCCAPYIWHPHNLGTKSASHMLALSTSMFVYYFTTKYVLVCGRDFKGAVARITALFAAAAFISSGYILLEVGVLGGYLGAGLLLPHASGELFEATVFGGEFMRPRGFATEPGTSALFIAAAMLITFSRQFVQRIGPALFTIYALTLMCAYLCLVSSASLGSVGLAVVWMLIVGRGKGIGVICLLLLLTAGALYLLVPGDIIEQAKEMLILKATFDPSSLSGADRMERYRDALSVVALHPFGIGIGATAQMELDGRAIGGMNLPAGQVSLYFTLIVAGGLVGICMWIAFVLSHLSASMKNRSLPLGYSGALVYVLAHHLFITEYWTPTLWVVLAVVMAAQSHYSGMLRRE